MKSIFIFLFLQICFSSQAQEVESQFGQIPKVIMKHQWGLKNSGGYQSADLNPVKSHLVKSVTGVDVQVPSFLKKNKKVIVAVLDTGIDKSHPWLKHRILKKEKSCELFEKYMQCLNTKKTEAEKNTQDSNSSPAQISNASIRSECKKIHFDENSDPEGDGYPLDCSGWSLTNERELVNGIRGQPDFSDESGHGTHVAGIIAQVSPNAMILPVQVLPQEPNAPVKAQSLQEEFKYSNDEKNLPASSVLGDFIARGVIYAVKSGAEVINFSAGWNPGVDSKFLREVIRDAQKIGVLFVTAAGNDSTQALLRPCVYPGVICVGSHNPDGSVSHFSNHGPHVDILAPGLNIFSAFPTELVATLFRDEAGYNYYSGTSQATPFVAGAVAEMIAAGFDKEEIYARLVLSAKKTLPFQGVFEGLPHEVIRPSDSNFVDSKKVLSGRLQISDAFQLQPEPLILITNKEAQELRWNRIDKDLSIKFQVKNHWQDVLLSDLKFNFSIQNELYKNEIMVSNPLCNFSAVSVWKQGQVFECEASLSILNSVSETKMSSEIDVHLDVFIKNKKQRVSSVTSYEIFVPVSRQMQDSGTEVIPFDSQVNSGFQLVPIDDNFSKVADGLVREYFAIKKNKDFWQVAGVQYINGRYKMSPFITTALNPRDLREDDEDPDTNERDIYRDQFLIKGDIDQDGLDEYILGVIKIEYDKEIPTTDFYIFNSDFSDFRLIAFNGKVSILPFQFSWTGVLTKDTKKSFLRPAWVGPGFDNKKLNLREIWKNKATKDEPYLGQNPEIRFYYFDENFRVKSINEINGYRIVDLLHQNIEDKQVGETPVLLAKNSGTKLNPTYFYDFAVAKIKNGQIAEFQKLNWEQFNTTYINLLDTRVDKVHNLYAGGDEYIGTYWFGNSFNGQQKVVQLVQDQSNKYILKQIDITRSAFPFDFPSLVRASYFGDTGSSAYTLTNSEIQFSAEYLKREVLTSQNRFTFVGQNLSGNLIFPITIQQIGNSNKKIPALYEAQNEGLTSGAKILAPVFAYDNKPETIMGIVAPARLRFVADRKLGCLPIATPYYNKTYHLEFFCRDRILRMKLEM